MRLVGYLPMPTFDFGANPETKAYEIDSHVMKSPGVGPLHPINAVTVEVDLGEGTLPVWRLDRIGEST
jgi:hypothetical protein